MISKFPSFWLVLVAAICIVLLAGCGDTFRQFITPVPGPTGDPASLSHAVVTSTNPTATGLGSDMHVDVSGDSLVGNVNLGHNPLFFNSNQGRVFIVNGDGTVSLYTGLLPLTTAVNTATLPPSTSGAIAASAGNNGGIYVANSGSNDVSFIPLTTTAVTQVIPTGLNPVMVAGGGNSAKIYVVNHGDNTVTVISTIDNTFQKTIPVGSQPIWAVMSSDGEAVFVVNQGDGTLSFIDTSVDQEICGSGGSIVPCTPANRIHVGSSPNFAFYDTPRRRVYVTNTGSNSISLINANGINFGVTPPVLPTKVGPDIALSGSPTGMVALQNGSKAYAALGGCPAGINHTNLIANLPSCTGNSISVIDLVALHESKVIVLPQIVVVPPTATGTFNGTVSIDASADSSRVYVVHANDQISVPDTTVHVPPAPPNPPVIVRLGSVSVIRTSNDAELRNGDGTIKRFSAPQQDPACTPKADPDNPGAGLLPCSLQVPFMVRVIP
jgi:YVTN family beta-propeller protein